MFEPGVYVVVPGHGVGQVLGKEEKDLGGQILSFYSVKIISNGMKVMVPTNSKDGIRPLVENTDIEEVFRLLGDHEVEVDKSTWNRRYRDYVGKIKTGSILEIADVLRSLLLLKVSKKLSFGERKMLEQCRDLLVQEIAISTGDPEKEIIGKIDSMFT